MKLWIVGQYRGHTRDNVAAWDFQGVFDSEKKALAACHTDDYFVGPVELNESLPHETAEAWPGCYYPHLEAAR